MNTNEPLLRPIFDMVFGFLAASGHHSPKLRCGQSLPNRKKWHSIFLVLNPHVLNLLNSWFLVFLQLDSYQTSIMPGQDPEKVITQLNDGKYMAYLTQEKHWNRKIFDTLPEADAWVTERARIYRHSKDAFENRVSTFTPDRWRPGFSNKSQQKQLLRSNTAPGNYAFSQTSSAQQTSITFPQAEVCRFF